MRGGASGTLKKSINTADVPLPQLEYAHLSALCKAYGIEARVLFEYGESFEKYMLCSN